MGAKEAVGRFGVWNTDLRSENPPLTSRNEDAAAELEDLGYGAIWLGSSPDVVHAEPLLDATRRIVVATGILNIWEHPPAGVAARVAAVRQRHSERLVLGLGASHPQIVAGYQRPYSRMVDFLDELNGVPPEWIVLAALGPRMLRLARDRTAGAHPYLAPVTHTARAREILGPDPLLAPEVGVVIEPTAERGRAVARTHLMRYLGMTNYTDNFLRMDFAEDDLRDGGSDRLIDALYLWGEPETIRDKAEEHYAAGADHLALQVIRENGDGPPLPEWRRLAEVFKD